MTTPPASDSETANGESRRERLATRRRRRVRIGLGITAVIVLVGAAAASVYATTRDDTTAAPPVAGGEKSAAPFDNRLPEIDDADKATLIRAFSHDEPLRLWVGGDSLSGSFGPALGDLVGATGVVSTEVDYKVSSGLWASDARNWPAHAEQAMLEEDPEIVVFMIGTNDASAVNTVDNNGDGVADWEVTYREQMNGMLDTFIGEHHRTVLWLGPPTLGTRSMDKGAVELGRVMKEEAAKRGDDVVYVDTYRLFSVDSGEYSRSIVDENGEEITVRISDGVHFSQQGAEYLARALFALIDTRFKIVDHADPDEPIGWNFASGSGETPPGYSSTPRSRYGSSNNSYTPTSTAITVLTSPPTTVPLTVAPTTVPPTTVPPTTPKTTVPPTVPPTTVPQQP